MSFATLTWAGDHPLCKTIVGHKWKPASNAKCAYPEGRLYKCARCGRLGWRE